MRQAPSDRSEHLVRLLLMTLPLVTVICSMRKYMKKNSFAATVLTFGGIAIGFNIASCGFYALDSSAPDICLYLWLLGMLCGGSLVAIGIVALRTVPTELDSRSSQRLMKRWPVDKNGFVHLPNE